MRSYLLDTPKDKVIDWLLSRFQKSGQDTMLDFKIVKASYLEPKLEFELTFETELFSHPKKESSFKLENYFFSGGSIAQYIAPLVDAKVPQNPFLCIPWRLKESFTLKMGDKLKFNQVPTGMTLKEKNLEYKSTYSLAGSTLITKRSLLDLTPDPICTPKDLEASHDWVKKIQKVVNSIVSLTLQ